MCFVKDVIWKWSFVLLGCLLFISAEAQDTSLYYNSSQEYLLTPGYTAAPLYFSPDTTFQTLHGFAFPRAVPYSLLKAAKDSVRTDLFFKTGSNNYQHFVSKHQQYVSRHVRMFNAINTFYTDGFYSNSKNAYFNIAGWFHGKYKGWKATLKYNYLRTGVQEYGGLRDDSLNFLISDRRYADTYFSNALNKYKRLHLTANLQKKITETLIVLYQSDINRETAVFQDDLTDSTAYLHYGEFDVFNDAEWQDSMYFFTANQQMGVQLNKRKMSMAMMLNFQPSEMWWRNSKIYFNEWSSEMFFQYFRFKAQGKYVFNGYNAGANQVKISYGNLLRDSSKFQWKIQLVRITQKPSVMAYWHSDITKFQEVIKGKAELYWHPYNTGLQITYRNDKNKAYLYSDGNFYQADGQLLQITLRQPFYYKFAGLDNNLQHNRSLGAFDVYRLPEWILSSHIFFRYHLFKKKINFTTGIKVSWFSQAYLNTWNPVYRNYMLQNNSIQGNYPVLDFLFTAQIKTFKAFVNILHINDGFTGNNYYLLPQYPVYGRWFQAGIQWIFLD